ncbi:leukotriene C4 synthase isoform X3 [Notechis scutatus]|uniref:Leukotriene C4 synthase isoform X3 n=1 Tax=Notechis scutatus TaxID=8663 RepID=A0A6J1VGD4_9SAUR|nr:leukotriene C4 synthase isoform X3 [Notechis scutatus]
MTELFSFTRRNNELLFTFCSPPAYFAIQVIVFRRKFKVSPPIISGPPEFERIFRAQTSYLKLFHFSLKGENDQKSKLFRIFPNISVPVMGGWNLFPSSFGCILWTNLPVCPLSIL